MSSASASPIPSSRYVDGGLYERLISEVQQSRTLEIGDATAVLLECMALLHHEARLLDQRRYEEWLDLYASECIYWVPMDDCADPRTCVSIVFDDRRRMEDRVIRLVGGFALNQVPEPRSMHQLSNIEAWSLPDGRRRVMSIQIVHERRAGRHQLNYLGHVEHMLVQEGGDWRIQQKRITLLNRDDGLESTPLL